MYIVFINNNGEEEFNGLYERVCEDSRTDESITFLCTKKDGEQEYITTPYAFELITEAYYKG